MIKTTTLDIIKMLPFEKSFQLKLLEQFDKLNPDQKFELEQMLWDTYDAIYELKLQENLDLALAKVKTHEETLDKDFYARAKRLTEEQMEGDLLKNTSGFDISNIRTKLESIVKEDSPKPEPA